MAGPEKPEATPRPPEKREAREPGKEEAPRQTKPMELLRSKVQKLEESDISGDIKELMDGWLLAHIDDPTAREAYIQKVKERGSDIKIGEMLEGMADIYLGQHPDVNERFQANPSEELPKVFEGMFDVFFQWALSINEGEDRKEARQKVEQILARMKEIIR